MGRSVEAIRRSSLGGRRPERQLAVWDIRISVIRRSFDCAQDKFVSSFGFRASDFTGRATFGLAVRPAGGHNSGN